ncbi:MAG: hypothetical protein BHV68_02710 [Bacteroidales bacterium 43_8]|nr:MAG: hypothetical protein BHV68_02710 [Bacteroidales bacterium 43_8]
MLDDENLRMKCLELLSVSGESYDICDSIVAASMLVVFVKTGKLPVSGYQKMSVEDAIHDVYKILEEKGQNPESSTNGTNDDTGPLEDKKTGFFGYLFSLGKKPVVSQRFDSTIRGMPPE